MASGAIQKKMWINFAKKKRDQISKRKKIFQKIQTTTLKDKIAKFVA